MTVYRTRTAGKCLAIIEKPNKFIDKYIQTHTNNHILHQTALRSQFLLFDRTGKLYDFDKYCSCKNYIYMMCMQTQQQQKNNDFDVHSENCNTTERTIVNHIITSLAL